MFAGEELKRIEEAKRLLILQADLHRQMLLTEAASLGEQVESFRPSQILGRFNRPLLLLGAAAVGVLAIRYRQRLIGWVSSGAVAWRWFNRISGWFQR